MASTTDRELLDKSREIIKEQQKVLERLSKAPLIHGTVLSVGKQRLTIAKGAGEILDVEKCEFDLAPGDGLLIDPEGGQILEKTVPLPLGEPVTILRIVDKTRAEVAINGSNRIIFTGTHKVKENDEVLLDRTGSVIIHTVQHEKPRFAVHHETNVNWASIGGQEEAKAAMKEAVELPFKSPDIFKAYGKKAAKGILLSGPPGCGKTMLGKAAATAIQALTGSQKSGFLYVKGPEVLDPYVGVAEATVRKIFMRAKEHKAAHGSPAVVFIDEADAILGKRGTIHSFMEKTIVPAFLTEMDGMEESGAMVILATNRPDTLDPAVVRDGRIDRKITVSRPTLRDAAEIFALYLGGVPLHKEHADEVEELAASAALALYEKERVLYHLTLRGQSQTVDVPLSALASGALIAGVVDKAVSLALNRDVAAKLKKPTGVKFADIENGIMLTHRENIGINHDDIFQEVAHGHEVTHKRPAILPVLQVA